MPYVTSTGALLIDASAVDADDVVYQAGVAVRSSTYTGMRAFVTDSNTALTAGIGAIVAAGGSNVVPVFCDGTNWRIG